MVTRMRRSRWLVLSCVLLMTLGLGACGGDEGGGDASQETSDAGAEQQPETEAAEASDADAAEQQLTIEAEGTATAFIGAVGDDDEQLFCGIVNQFFLDKFFKKLNLDRASCQERFEGVEFKPFDFLAGATVNTENTVVEEADEGGPAVAVVTIASGPDTSTNAVMRREGDRWVIKDLQAP